MCACACVCAFTPQRRGQPGTRKDPPAQHRSGFRSLDTANVRAELTLRWGVERHLRPLPTRCQSQPPDTPISLQLLYPSQAQPCPSHQKLYSLAQKLRGREPNVNRCVWFASVFKGSNQLSTSRTSPVSFQQFGKLGKQLTSLAGAGRV